MVGRPQGLTGEYRVPRGQCDMIIKEMVPGGSHCGIGGQMLPPRQWFQDDSGRPPLRPHGYADETRQTHQQDAGHALRFHRGWQTPIRRRPPLRTGGVRRGMGVVILHDWCRAGAYRDRRLQTPSHGELTHALCTRSGAIRRRIKYIPTTPPPPVPGHRQGGM